MLASAIGAIVLKNSLEAQKDAPPRNNFTIDRPSTMKYGTNAHNHVILFPELAPFRRATEFFNTIGAVAAVRTVSDANDGFGGKLLLAQEPEKRRKTCKQHEDIDRSDQPKPNWFFIPVWVPNP